MESFLAENEFLIVRLYSESAILMIYAISKMIDSFMIRQLREIYTLAKNKHFDTFQKSMVHIYLYHSFRLSRMLQNKLFFYWRKAIDLKYIIEKH
jgi:hypothetical protein